jgi:hypothetical protein
MTTVQPSAASKPQLQVLYTTVAAPAPAQTPKPVICIRIAFERWRLLSSGGGLIDGLVGKGAADSSAPESSAVV